LDAETLLKKLAFEHIEQCENLLEVGAGSGALLIELSDYYRAPACGIDLYAAEENGGLTALPSETPDRLPKRFDLIFSLHSFHHFSKGDEFFKVLEKKLTWDGKFILIDRKSGGKTGISEKYFDLEEVVSAMKSFNFEVIDRGIHGQNFYLIAGLKVRKLAVATEDGKSIYEGMFGGAPYFDIYRFSRRQGFMFEERRENKRRLVTGDSKTADVYEETADCQALLSQNIAKRRRDRLKEMGFKLFFRRGSVSEALKDIEL